MFSYFDGWNLVGQERYDISIFAIVAGAALALVISLIVAKLERISFITLGVLIPGVSAVIVIFIGVFAVNLKFLTVTNIVLAISAAIASIIAVIILVVNLVSKEFENISKKVVCISLAIEDIIGLVVVFLITFL